jgi:3-oxoacyl-[acyl-carrier-protein] synthase-3
MKARSGAPGARILAVADHRPARSVSNDDLSQVLDTSDEWIRERTGIAHRGVADAAESVVAMAADAAGKALAAAGVDPAQVDLVVLASCTMPTPIPGGAARLARLIGAGSPGAYDVNGACAGFCYGLAAAADAVRAGSARYVVVAGAERLSDWLDWTDRSTAVIFGDGAGAVVVGPADEPGIGPVVWGSDGDRHALIQVPSGGHLEMDGPAVFRWATTSLAAIAAQACDAAGIAPSDLAAFVPHQANLRIITAVVRRLAIPDVVIADDIVSAGNTSSASIPMALTALQAEGRVAGGDLALLLGFGAGLTWAGQVVRVP